MTDLPEKIYAVDEHGHDTLPWPMPADTWMWQSGDRWVAVVGMWHTDWWEGADEDDIAARPDDWCRHILDVPDTGSLVFNNSEGRERSMPAPPGTLRHRVFAGDGHPEDEGSWTDMTTDELCVWLVEQARSEVDGDSLNITIRTFDQRQS